MKKKEVLRNTEDEVLTQQELASEWKVSKRFIEVARTKYELPFFKLGNLVRFRKSEVDTWFQQRKIVA